MLIAVLHRRHELRSPSSARAPVPGNRRLNRRYNEKGTASKNDNAPLLGIIYHLKVACFCPAFPVTYDYLGINFLMQRPLDPFSFHVTRYFPVGDARLPRCHIYVRTLSALKCIRLSRQHD